MDDCIAMDPLTLVSVLSLAELALESLAELLLSSLSFRCDMNYLFLYMHFSHALDPQKSQNRLSFFCKSFSHTIQLLDIALSRVGSVSLNISS